MLPILKLASDNREQSTRRIKELLAEKFLLSHEEKGLLSTSGKGTIFANRVDWALTYLRHTKMIRKTRRGFFVITKRGLEALREKPKRIDIRFLRQYPELVEFLGRS
jgi:restriction system protein